MLDIMKDFIFISKPFCCQFQQAISYLLDWFFTISYSRDKVREVSGVLDNYIKHKHYQHATRLLKTNGGFCEWSAKLVNTWVTDNFVSYRTTLPDSACLSVSCVQKYFYFAWRALSQNSARAFFLSTSRISNPAINRSNSLLLILDLYCKLQPCSILQPAWIQELECFKTNQ